jgi:hypothetical protein
MCRLAMIADQPDAECGEFNTYRCLSCDLTIATTPSADGNEK